MKLYVIVFGTSGTAEARVRSYVDLPDSELSHLDSDGFTVVKETINCWFLDEYPEGLPRQYRKNEEYKVVNNSHAIYMFGQDPSRLVEEWNRAASA